MDEKIVTRRLRYKKYFLEEILKDPTGAWKTALHRGEYTPQFVLWGDTPLTPELRTEGILIETCGNVLGCVGFHLDPVTPTDTVSEEVLTQTICGRDDLRDFLCWCLDHHRIKIEYTEEIEYFTTRIWQTLPVSSATPPPHKDESDVSI